MSDRAIYPVDPNHVGLRVSVLCSLTLGGVAGAVVFPAIAKALGVSTIAPLWIGLLGAVVLGASASWLADRWLRHAWPSGRRLITNREALELREKETTSAKVYWAGRLNVTCWYFIIPHSRASVPKGWYCAACRLLQDDSAIIVYALIDPRKARAISVWPQFQQLHSQRALRPSGVSAVSPTDDQGVLRAAEKDRWTSGVEMTPEHFESLLHTIEHHVSDWAM